MTTEPFAYAIQAPIGSVTPLFHKRKDAEDYIAKLTDSRDEAKIIPLYREPPVYALSGNAENVDRDDIAMVGRAHADNLIGEPGITELMHVMANEIDTLRRSLTSWKLEAEVHQNRARAAVVEIARLRLTDAERAVLADEVELYEYQQRRDVVATLRGLLERHKGGGE